MTPTDELRTGLDELGVEWTDGGMFHRTHWERDGIHYDVFDNGGKLYLQASRGPLTPAQAIAATLGRTAKRVNVPYRSHVSLGHYECGACGQVVDEGDRFCKQCGAGLEGE